MNYPGGKGSCYQRIINMIPPHRVYIESHLGGGAIMRRKAPARLNIGVDINPIALAAAAAEIAPGSTVINGGARASSGMAVEARTTISGDGRRQAPSNDGDRWQFHCLDAVQFLAGYPFSGNEFVYCDPPYLMHTRIAGRLIYDYEYTDQDHERLLSCLLTLPCPVAISGYWSEMYADTLSGWHTTSFTAQTRGGVATEWLWMNYPEPAALHEYTYLGDNYRERERIKRKKTRWVNRLKKMDALERKAIMWAIQEAGILPS